MVVQIYTSNLVHLYRPDYGSVDRIQQNYEVLKDNQGLLLGNGKRLDKGTLRISGVVVLDQLVDLGISLVV